jgi:hypothetical protein
LKVITKDKIVYYTYPDEKFIAIRSGVDEDMTVIGDPPELYIADINTENGKLFENVNDIPSDFVITKYLYDGSTWTLNPYYRPFQSTPSQPQPTTSGTQSI